MSTASLVSRLRARARIRGRVGLWYHPAYAPCCLARTSRVPELPIDRVEMAVGRLAEEGVLRPGDVRPAHAASFDDLGRVHTPRYLESVTRPETLARIFALPEESVEVDPMLSAQRRAVGGTLEAARAAASGATRVAFNLGGGFHHAEPDRGGGFCVFNDVAVAVALLRQAGFEDPVAIVDLDFHQGNGNVAAFESDASVLTWSIQGSTWTHVQAVADEQIVLPVGTGDEAYLAALREALPRALDRHRPRLVFYLAGNDVLAGDALGTFALTPAGVLARDRFVFEEAERAGAAVVATLAGGYSEDAWRCTANLLRWLLTGVAEVRGGGARELRERFTAIAARLDPAVLTGGPRDFDLSESDILRDLTEHRPPARVLDFYSASGIEYGFERYGILDKIRRRGFAEIRFALDTSDPARPVARILGRARRGAPEVLLMELAVRRVLRPRPPAMGPGDPLDLLAVEWLLLQDPTRGFTLRRPPLPGQQHPGLGIARDIQEVLVQACRRVGLAGIVSRPSRYHHAFAAAPACRFLDPAAEGRFRALRQALAHWPIGDAAVLLEAERVRAADGKPIAWEPADLVLPVAPELEEYLHSEGYREARETARGALLAGGIVAADFGRAER